MGKKPSEPNKYNTDYFINNVEELVDFPEDEESEDWSKYNPSLFDTESDLFNEVDYALDEKRLGIAFYYLTLILKYENFEDVITSIECKLPKEKTEEVYMADGGIVPLYTMITSDLRYYFKEKNINISLKGKSLEEQCKIIKEHSVHYSDYKKMKELFGTKFRPKDSFL